MDTAKLSKRLHRLKFYTQHALVTYKPRSLAMRQWQRWQRQLTILDDAQRQALQQRVDYYNRLSTPFPVEPSMVQARNFRLKGHNSAYFLDVAALLPYFSAESRFAYEFGDVTQIMPYPAWVKSRPITTDTDDNANSVLLKLDSVRHFYIPPDPIPYSDKLPKLVWRGAAYQSHRLALLQRFADHPLCNIGCVADISQGKPYHAEFMSIVEQQRYRFILSIEGNDVATNLKWIMASNSLCFMTRPKYETWFMEGSLQAGKHFVLLRDDYADLAEKIEYYLKHEDEARDIIANANRYVQVFLQPQKERLLQLMVMQKYFDLQH